MKHPAELDLHDADKLEIDRLEQENIRLQVDLDNLRDKIGETEMALTEATFALMQCQERGDGR